jgi:hypothetical protein
METTKEEKMITQVKSFITPFILGENVQYNDL